jgi:hypothetical protein
MLVVIKSQLRNLVLIGCFMLLCHGIQVAHAQNFGAASLYLLYSNSALSSGWSNIDYALYYNNAGYFYNSYSDLTSAYNYANTATSYAYAGYLSSPTTINYYSYYYSYYNSYYLYYAYSYAYYSYVLGRTYVPSLISYIDAADDYNGYAAYYCGLSSVGGTK